LIFRHSPGRRDPGRTCPVLPHQLIPGKNNPPSVVGQSMVWGGGVREKRSKRSHTKNDFSFLFSAEHQSLDRECQLQRTGQEATRLRLIQLPGGTSLQYFRGGKGGTSVYWSLL